MKDTSTSAASPISQEALDSLLITAAGNPRGEAQDENGLTQTVAGLLAQGANVNGTSDGFTALIAAAYNGHTEIVSALLSRDGINVNAVASRGTTALMLAAHSGDTEIVSALLSRDEINVNAATSNGNTALMIAAHSGDTEIVSALLSRDGINVNAATTRGTTALMIAADNGHAETVLALLSRDGVDWQIVQSQLSHPSLQNLNKEVSALLAVTLPEGELRNSIIESFNQRNPNSPINQENNDILGAGTGMYKTLKDLKSLYKRYLIDPIDPDSGLGLSEHEAENLANQRFFDLLNHQDMRKEALARNDLITALVGESAFLAINSGFGDEDALGRVREINPEDFYTLTTKIIDSGKDESGIPKLKDSLVVAALREDRKNQASASPATTISNSSIKPVTKENGGASRS